MPRGSWFSFLVRRWTTSQKQGDFLAIRDAMRKTRPWKNPISCPKVCWKKYHSRFLPRQMRLFAGILLGALKQRFSASYGTFASCSIGKTDCLESSCCRRSHFDMTLLQLVTAGTGTVSTKCRKSNFVFIFTFLRHEIVSSGQVFFHLMWKFLPFPGSIPESRWISPRDQVQILLSCDSLSTVSWFPCPARLVICKRITNSQLVSCCGCSLHP